MEEREKSERRGWNEENCLNCSTIWKPTGAVENDSQSLIAVDSLHSPPPHSCIIVHLRLLTSAYLRTHSDDFTPFLFALEDDPRFLQEGGSRTMENFCQYHVEPVSREADHLQIVALTRALGTPLRIAYLDQSGLAGVGGSENGGGGEVNFLEFEEDRAKEDGIVSVEGALLYRPGHYDVLYR